VGKLAHPFKNRNDGCGNSIFAEQRVGERACDFVFEIPAQVQLWKLKDGRAVAIAAVQR